MSNFNFPSWVMGPFIRPENVNPIIKPNPDSVFQCPMHQKPIKWEALHTFNPTAIVRNNQVYLFYRAEDNTGEMKIGSHTSRLGLAISSDGVQFQRNSTPVFYPDNDSQKKHEWTGGCEDPRIFETEDGQYVLYYTQYNHKIPKLGVAISKDLIHWEKFGPVFRKWGLQLHYNLFTKSAGLLTTLKDDRLIAIKINGKYWMYWGERSLHLASSSDLIHWDPGVVVARPEQGFFDSQLTEMGPAAIITEEGIVVIYNGKNHAVRGDKNYPADVYAGGQFLFDKNHPSKLIGRTKTPFFKPEMEFEKTGQYQAGTTFLEGLVFFQKKWYLYYGCADSLVGVAVWKP